MEKENSPLKTLSEYTDALQKQGKFAFNIDEVISALGITLIAARHSAHRLSKKRRLFRAYRHFYVIVPLEYQDVGCPPPELFINLLMQHMETDYYVGLLSAAAFYGAISQQPTCFQIITAKYSRLIGTPHTNIQLYQSSCMYKNGIEQQKTPAGYISVSTPELTAFDLVRYARVIGSYNQVATVLGEFGKRLRAKKLSTLAKKICQEHGEWAYWQRLGYLLDTVGHKHIADPLATVINSYQPSFSYFVPGKTENILEKSSRWRLYINETIKTNIITSKTKE